MNTNNLCWYLWITKTSTYYLRKKKPVYYTGFYFVKNMWRFWRFICTVTVSACKKIDTYLILLFIIDWTAMYIFPWEILALPAYFKYILAYWFWFMHWGLHSHKRKSICYQWLVFWVTLVICGRPSWIRRQHTPIIIVRYSTIKELMNSMLKIIIAKWLISEQFSDKGSSMHLSIPYLTKSAKMLSTYSGDLSGWISCATVSP